jgi:hypothetical protein
MSEFVRCDFREDGSQCDREVTRVVWAEPYGLVIGRYCNDHVRLLEVAQVASITLSAPSH